jgi:hypothetical protein
MRSTARFGVESGAAREHAEALPEQEQRQAVLQFRARRGVGERAGLLDLVVMDQRHLAGAAETRGHLAAHDHRRMQQRQFGLERMQEIGDQRRA